MQYKNFVIKETLSGNSDAEITRAKELYFEGVNNGNILATDNVLIRFKANGAIIFAQYIDLDDNSVIGETAVSRHPWVHLPFNAT